MMIVTEKLKTLFKNSNLDAIRISFILISNVKYEFVMYCAELIVVEL